MHRLNSLRFLSLLGYYQFTKGSVQLDQDLSRSDEFLYNTSSVKQLDNKDFTYKLKTRKEHIDDIKKTNYDVVILGGGATGSGIALECSQRGLRSLLLESDDFAHGASSKSTKLVHGGVRYLQQVFELSTEGGRWEKLKLVIEALKERSIFLTISQMHTKEIPILIPCSTIFHALYYYSGTMLYHMIYKLFQDTNTFQFAPPRIVIDEEIKAHYGQSDAKWGVLYTDGQFNDSRMVQELLLTSTLDKYHLKQTSRSNILNYCDVKSFDKDANGKITAVNFVDKISKNEFKAQTKVVVNATGCFADQIRKMDNPDALNKIVPSGGTHIVLKQEFGSLNWGFLVPNTNDGRVLFVLPWLGFIVVGTTDKLFNDPQKDPTASDEELRWLVEQFATAFPKYRTSEVMANITSKWCGIRPLVLEQGYKPGDKIDTKKVARGHSIEVTPSGLVSVMGGKWTIYRRMAEDAVTEINKYLNEKGLSKLTLPSVSKNIKLIGDFERRAQDPQQDRKLYLMKYIKALQQRYKITQSEANYFIKTYGERAFDIMKLTQQDPEYSRKIHPDLPHTVGEVIYLIRYEMATSPQDIMFRRTRLGFLDGQIIYKLYPDMIEIFAKEFKWDKKEKQIQLRSNMEQIRKLCF